MSLDPKPNVPSFSPLENFFGPRNREKGNVPKYCENYFANQREGGVVIDPFEFMLPEMKARKRRRETFSNAMKKLTRSQVLTYSNKS